MVAQHDSMPGRQSGLTPAAGTAAELAAQVQTRLAEMQRGLDEAAEQVAVIKHGTAVLAELAAQVQTRLAAGPAADEMKLDELAELLRCQSPARQRLLMETLEGAQNDESEDEDAEDEAGHEDAEDADGSPDAGGTQA